MSRPDTQRTGSQDVSVRHYLLIAALVLGLPLTAAWIGLLGLLGYDAISWLIDRALG